MLFFLKINKVVLGNKRDVYMNIYVFMKEWNVWKYEIIYCLGLFENIVSIYKKIGGDVWNRLVKFYIYWSWKK